MRPSQNDPLLPFGPRCPMSAFVVRSRSQTPDSVRQRCKAELSASSRSCWPAIHSPKQTFFGQMKSPTRIAPSGLDYAFGPSNGQAQSKAKLLLATTMICHAHVRDKSLLGFYGKPKWSTQSVECVHCGDGNREVNQVFGREMCRGRGVCLI